MVCPTPTRVRSCNNFIQVVTAGLFKGNGSVDSPLIVDLSDMTSDEITAFAVALAGDSAAMSTLAAAIVSGNTNNLLKIGTDGLLMVDVCALNTAEKQCLSAEVISSDAANALTQGTDERLFVPAIDSWTML